LPQLSLSAWAAIALAVLLAAVIEAWYTEHKTLAEAQGKRLITQGHSPTTTPLRGRLRKYGLPICLLSALVAAYQFWPVAPTVNIILPPATGKLEPVAISSVADLYRNDFRLRLRMQSRHLVILPGGARRNLEEMIPLSAAGEYSISFFIRSSSKSSQLAEWTAGGYSVAIGDIMSNVSMNIQIPGRPRFTLPETRFNGRVYLYHEDELSPERKLYVAELFRRNNATVVFRGFLEVLGGAIEQ
jgi:hypothetical protein